jgi:hypothetical protein
MERSLDYQGRWRNKTVNEVKLSYTNLINIYVATDKEKLKVFDKTGLYLPTKKVGKIWRRKWKQIMNFARAGIRPLTEH